MGSEHLEQGLSQKLLLYIRYVLLAVLPCLASVGEKVPSLEDLKCWGGGDTQQEPPPLRGEKERGKKIEPSSRGVVRLRKSRAESLGTGQGPGRRDAGVRTGAYHSSLPHLSPGS